MKGNELSKDIFGDYGGLWPRGVRLNGRKGIFGIW